MSAERIFRIIDEAESLKVGLLAISGGEPFMRNDCLKILSYASKRVNTVIATNGTLINDYMAQVLAGMNIKLQISLDGPKNRIHDNIRGNGAFARTMKAVDLLCEKGANERIALCVTVSKNNINHIPLILKLAVKKGISSLRFIPLQYMGMARLHWDELVLSAQDYSRFYTYLFQKARVQFPNLHISPGFQGFVLSYPSGKTMWCRIGKMISIEANGEIYPCPQLMEPPFRLGHIQEMGLKQALDSPKMKGIKEMCLLRRDRIPKYRSCTWKHFCQGGCAGSIYQQKGHFYDTDDLCELRKKLYPQTILDLAARRSHHLSVKKGKDLEFA